jgi:hypothetical protein
LPSRHESTAGIERGNGPHRHHADDTAAAQATDSGRHHVIAPSSRRARQRHDGVRRSRHVSDPQPRAGGCRLEATHSVPPEIRTCDRRPGKLNAVLQTVPDKFGLPLRFAARNGAQRKLGRSSQDPDDRKRGDRHPSTVRAALAAYHVITATRSEPSTGCPLLRAKVGS